MADYKRMYSLMVKETDRALTELESGSAERAKDILRQVLLDAEELYVSEETSVTELKVLHRGK